MEFKVSVAGFQPKTKIEGNSITFFYPGSDEFRSCPYVLTLQNGSYIFECWGAWGYNIGFPGYTSGDISINETTTFYLYIGGGFSTHYIPGISFNGGGSGDYGGGGSSDIRYINGLWNNFQSLKSRVMVAGGGGGTDCSGAGGYGGGLNGTDGFSTNHKGRGGTQTSGGIGHKNGGFGYGGSSFRVDSNGTRLDNGGGGGSGYYGGSTGALIGGCSGGGGSSFISGYPGCDAIHEESTFESIIHTGQNIHYSGYVFSNPVMITGGESMPLPDGTHGFGTYSSGSIRITSLNGFGVKQCTTCQHIFNIRIFYNCILHLFIFSTKF